MQKEVRPKILGGITVKVTTGCGNMYVQLNWKNGRLFEVFATLGKSGGCASCQIEALTRSITLGLRCGILPEEYIDQLRAIRCPSPLPFPRESAVSSCPDAISKTLEQYGNLAIEDVVKTICGVNPSEVISVEEEEKRAKEAVAQLAKIREEQDL